MLSVVLLLLLLRVSEGESDHAFAPEMTGELGVFFFVSFFSLSCSTKERNDDDQKQIIAYDCCSVRDNSEEANAKREGQK